MSPPIRNRTPETSPAPKRGRGRPRDVELEKRLLRASLEVLAEGGFSGLSVEKICARAQVQKLTFYRRWSSPIDAALEALKVFDRPLVLDDTGDLAADLQGLLKKAIALYRDPLMGACQKFLTTEASIRPEIASALRELGEIRRTREVAELEARMRRERYGARLGAELIHDVIFSVSTGMFAQSRSLSDNEVAALITTLLGPPALSVAPSDPSTSAN
jgi:AcrR family transcriptional regulator